MFGGRLGRTYRYYTGKVLFPFGYGLSFWGAASAVYYTPTLSAAVISACDYLSVTVTVGLPRSPVTGDEVVQLYVSVPRGNYGFPVPLLSLQAFRRVLLTEGETMTFPVGLDAWSMSVTDAQGDRVIVPGQYTVYVGGGQPASTTHASSASSSVPGFVGSVAMATFNVTTPGGFVNVAKACNVPRPCYGCM